MSFLEKIISEIDLRNLILFIFHTEESVLKYTHTHARIDDFKKKYAKIELLVTI